MIGFTTKGLEGVARMIRSYVEDGHSYHYGLERFMMSSDLILTDEEEAAISATYGRLFNPGPVFIVAMLCAPGSVYQAVHYGPEHGKWYDYWLDGKHCFRETDSMWFIPGTLTFASC